VPPVPDRLVKIRSYFKPDASLPQPGMAVEQRAKPDGARPARLQKFPKNVVEIS